MIIPGSADYYSLRKVPSEQRDAIEAILDFYREIEVITLSGVDANVAHLKLNWWRDEVVKINEGSPSHPVALQMKKSLDRCGLSALKLIEIIDGLEQNLTAPVFAKFEDVMIHFMRTAGKRELLVAEVLQAQEVNVEIIYQFAFVIEFAYYLQNVRKYLRCGLVYFAQDELQQFGVTVSQLQQYRTTSQIRDFLEMQTDKIERTYESACVGLNLLETPKLRVIKVRSRIAVAVMEAIRVSHFAVLENFIDLTALRRWWLSVGL